ncbi:MAG: transcription termination/antitermination NusG family protein [Verrucomicrobiota bacterium]
MEKKSGKQSQLWYCVLTKRKQEQIAASVLTSRNGFDTCAPLVRYRKNTRRGLVWFEEAMSPGYIFVHVSPEELRFVRSNFGIKRILTFNGAYATVPDQQMEILRQSLNEKQTKIFDAPLKKGDSIEVGEGPLKGMRGLVQRVMTVRKRVEILTELLGQWVRTEVSEDTVIRSNELVEKLR